MAYPGERAQPPVSPCFRGSHRAEAFNGRTASGSLLQEMRTRDLELQRDPQGAALPYEF
jgi:hypothetical protein